MNEYLAMWKNYVNFTDRTSVRGYWMAVLFNILISLGLGILSEFLSVFNYVAALYSLAVFIPGWAILIRRLRDAGKAWPWVFIMFIPIVGQIILLVFLCQGTKNFTGVQV